MTAKTINKNALYFRQAAYHLGEREAERHLIIAMESGTFYNRQACKDESHICLSAAFAWSSTEQGYGFWLTIYCAAFRYGIK